MNQKMLKRILCIVLVITIIFTTSYATEETIFAAEIPELPDISTDISESTENDDSTNLVLSTEENTTDYVNSTEFIESTENIMSTEIIEPAEDINSTESTESAEDIISTEIIESTEDIMSTEISESNESDSVLTDIFTSMENVLFSEKTSIPPDHSLSVVYWNPNSEDVVSGTGQTLQFKGNDDNSGASAKEPVLNLETAMKRVSFDGIIYCMNNYSIETSLTVDGGYYNISVKRDSSHNGNIIQIIENLVKISNLTLDGSDDFEERVITVGSGGTLEIGDSFGTVGQTLLFVERNANPIVLSGKPETGTVYRVQFAPDYYTNNPIVTEKAEEKLLVDASVSGLNPENYFSVENLPEEWDTYVKNGTELWARKVRFGDTVWLDGVNGDDANSGFFEDECVKTWERAYEIYQSKLKGNGKIRIKGTVTVSSGTLEIGKSVLERANGFTNPLFDVKAGAGLSIQSGVILEEENETSYYAVKSSGALTVSKGAQIDEIFYLMNREHPLELTGTGENKYRIKEGGNYQAGDLIVKNGIFPTVKLMPSFFGLLSNILENNSYLCDVMPIYVNGKSGNDAYDALTPGTAVSTLNRAVEVGNTLAGYCVIIYVMDAPANMSSGSVTLSSGMVLERYGSYRGDVLNMMGGTLRVEGDINGSVTEKGDADIIINSEYATLKDNISIGENASFTLENGTVSKNVTLSGSAVMTQNDGKITGTVTLKENCKFIQNKGDISGKIEQNGTGSSVKKDGGTMSGGVSISAGKFEMNDGEIEKSGVQLENGGSGSFLLHGGEIRCGVSINALGGSIQMDGGTVAGSSKGIYLAENASMEMTGGTVKRPGNESTIIAEGTLSLAKNPIIEGGIELRNPDHPIILTGKLDDGTVCRLNFGNMYVKPGETKTVVEGSSTVPATTEHFVLSDGVSYLLHLENEDTSGNLLVCAENEPEGIYWDGDAGDDTNTGVDREHAVKTFDRAKELIKKAYEEEGRQCNIYICGDIDVADEQTWSLEEFDWTPIVMRSPSLTDRQYGVYVQYNGTLTLQNIVMDANKKIIQIYPGSGGERGRAFFNVQGGTLNIESGAIIQNFNAAKEKENSYTLKNVVSISYGIAVLNGGCIRDNNPCGAAVGIIYNAKFEMKDGIIESNCNDKHGDGGGVYNWNGSFIMSGGVIRNNKANSGGGVYSNGKMEISGGEIIENEAVLGGGVAAGSFMHENSSFLMTGGKISGNYASIRGGGIISEDRGKNKIVIRGGEISGNHVLEYGGGICGLGNLCIENAVIRDNKAQYGGGIAVLNYSSIDTKLTLQGGTVTGNRADMGGGIYWNVQNRYDDGLNNISLEGGTIDENSAEKGDGIYVHYDGLNKDISGIALGKTQLNQEIYLGFNSNETKLLLIASPTDKTNRFPLTVDPKMAELGFAAVVPDGTNVTNAAQYLRNFYLKGNNGYALVRSGKNIVLGQAFFVDGENGSDTNKGNSPVSAFKTVNHALSALGDDPGTIYVCGTITVPAGTDEIWTMKEGQSLTRYEGYEIDDEEPFRGQMIVIEDGAELTMNHVTVYGSIDASEAAQNGYLLVQGGILNISSDSSLEDGTVYLKDGKTVTVTGSGTNLLMEVEKENPFVGDVIGRYQTANMANVANFKLSDEMIGFTLEEDEDKNSVILGQVEAVYVDGVNGDDGRDGATPETALKTMREAYEKIKGKGGVIYIVDTVSLAADTTLAGTYYQDETGTENRIEVSGTVFIRRYDGNKNPLINIISGTTILSNIRINGKSETTEPYNTSLIEIENGAVLHLDNKTGLNSKTTERVIYQAGTLYIDSADVSLGDGEIFLAKDAYVTVNAQIPGDRVYRLNMDKSDTAAGRTVAVFSEEALGKGKIGEQKEHFSIPSETTEKSLTAKGSDTLVLSENFDAELLQTEFFQQIGRNITFNVVPKNADPSDVTVTVKKGEETVPCTITDYNRYKRISLQVSEECIGMLTLELRTDRATVEKNIIVSGYEIRYAEGRESMIAEPQKEDHAGVHTDTAELIVYNGAGEARSLDIGDISIRYEDGSEVKIDNDAVTKNMEDAMGCYGVDVNSGLVSMVIEDEMMSIPVILSNGDKITEKKQGAIILKDVMFGSVYPRTDIDVKFETEPASYVQVCAYLDGGITTEPDVYVVNKDTKEKTELTKEVIELPGAVTRTVNGLLEAVGVIKETKVWPYRKMGLLEGDYEIYIKNPYTGEEVYTGKELHVEKGQTASQEINLYTVTYILNGGKFEDGTDKDIYIEGIGLEKLPSPSRESSRFAGWYENEDFAGTSVGKIGTESRRPYTLYAAWTIQDEWTDVNLAKTEYLEEMGSSLTFEAEIEGILSKEITVQVLQETADGETRTVPATVTDSGVYKLISVEVNPQNVGTLTLLFEQKDEEGIVVKEMERTVELSAYEVSYANGLGYLLAAPQEDGTDGIHTDRAAITIYNGSRDAARFVPGSWSASYEGRPDEDVWIDNSMVDKNMSENNAMRYFGMTLESEEITEIKPGEKATLNVIFSNGDMLTENRSGVITMENAGLGGAAADIPLNFRVRAITRFQLQLQLNDEMADEETVELRNEDGKAVTVNRIRTGEEPALMTAYRVLTGKTDIRWNYQLTGIEPGAYRLYINGKDANRRIQIKEGEIIQEKVDMYSIRYELNEGTLKEEMPSYYIKGAVQALPRPEKENCQFAGWYTSGTYSGEAISEIEETATGILKLYAKWDEITVTPEQPTRPVQTIQPTQTVQVSNEVSTEKTPKTSDRNLVIVDIAFVGGIACLAKMFLSKKDDAGMDEEDKERRVRSIIENAKGKGMMAGIGAAGLIFVTLLFYYTLGMNEETRCKMQK